MVELQAGNADAIVDGLKFSLDSYGLNQQKMCGIGTDNASVMIGINNGGHKKLKDEIPHLVL